MFAATQKDFNYSPDSYYIWQAYQGINGGWTQKKFTFPENFYLWEAILAGTTGGAHVIGRIDASTNPNYPAANQGDIYEISVKGKIGGAAGVLVEAGDLVIAIDANAGGTEAAVGANWDIVQYNLQQIFEISGSDLSFAVLRDLTETVGRNFSLAVVNNVTETVGNDLSLTVVRDWTGSIGRSYSLTVTLNSSETVGGSSTETIVGSKIILANQMGVGTSVPASKLHVKGSLNSIQFIVQAAAGQTIANPIVQLQDSAGGQLMDIRTNDATNIAIGADAGLRLTSGTTNTLIGSSTGRFITTGAGNTLVGYAIGYVGGSNGNNNSFFGYQPGTFALAGAENVGIGHTVLQKVTGNNNVGVGNSAGAFNTTGSNNIFIGYASGGQITTGSGNVFLGYLAGNTTTGNISNTLWIDNANNALPLIYGDFVNYRIGIGNKTPTATLHLPAGVAAVAGAPLKFTAGTLNTVPELGAMEYVDDGTTGHLYFTQKVATVTTRIQII